MVLAPLAPCATVKLFGDVERAKFGSYNGCVFMPEISWRDMLVPARKQEIGLSLSRLIAELGVRNNGQSDSFGPAARVVQ